jgi:hypothetical protein
VWLSESKAGFYVGLLGGQNEFHHSYHTDGMRHDKLDSECHHRFSDFPIALHIGLKQIYHVSLPMTNNWFNSASEYHGDEKTETIILLDEALLLGCDTVALDVWLLDRTSEPILFETVGRISSSNEQLHMVGEVVTALENFPNHKIALTLRSAKIRGVAL